MLPSILISSEVAINFASIYLAIDLLALKLHTPECTPDACMLSLLLETKKLFRHCIKLSILFNNDLLAIQHSDKADHRSYSLLSKNKSCCVREKRPPSRARLKVVHKSQGIP